MFLEGIKYMNMWAKKLCLNNIYIYLFMVGSQSGGEGCCQGVKLSQLGGGLGGGGAELEINESAETWITPLI